VKTKAFESRVIPGKKIRVIAGLKGVRFWVRVNEIRNLTDSNILKPISRIGGIFYSRVISDMEIPRPFFKQKAGPRGTSRVAATAEFG
jgi:hypothetical protein